MSMKYLSESANALIRKQFALIKIIGATESLNHDGSDELGPQSDLWDLYIVIDDHGRHRYYNFHRENWFVQGMNFSSLI